MSALEHVVLWRQLDLPGHDLCCHWKTEDGWRLSGTAVLSSEGLPCHLNYEVTIDSAWRTKAARVWGCMGTKVLDLNVVPASGHWTLNGVAQPKAEGCLDVDLGFTPATNWVVLRRLALNVGNRAEAPAAYLSFPDLNLVRLDQTYHKISATEYDYESPSAGYKGILKVNDYGAIIDYPELWEQEAVE
jgi:hypothetical protein